MPREQYGALAGLVSCSSLISQLWVRWIGGALSPAAESGDLSGCSLKEFSALPSPDIWHCAVQRWSAVPVCTEVQLLPRHPSTPGLVFHLAVSERLLRVTAGQGQARECPLPVAAPAASQRLED